MSARSSLSIVPRNLRCTSSAIPPVTRLLIRSRARASRTCCKFRKAKKAAAGRLLGQLPLVSPCRANRLRLSASTIRFATRRASTSQRHEILTISVAQCRKELGTRSVARFAERRSRQRGGSLELRQGQTAASNQCPLRQDGVG